MTTLWVSINTFAATADDPWKSGNALYAMGKFSEAAESYQSIADSGVHSWVLEYNLGNAYFRLGQIGKAILHYERAFRLNSGQKDVVYNLGLASAQANDPRLPSSALVLLAWKLFYQLSINAWTLLVSGLFITLAVVLGAALAGRPFVPNEFVAVLALVWVAAAAVLGARIYLVEHPKGVVISSVAEVRSGPSLSYPANFTVPEGHEVLMLQEQEPVQGWHQIGVPNEGLRGWVPESSVQPI